MGPTRSWGSQCEEGALWRDMKEKRAHWRQETSLCEGTEVWEGRVWCLREQSKEGPKGRSGQLRSLHPKIWVDNDRGTPTMESMMQRGTRPRRRGCGAACSCSAPPQGFEADVPTASQSLS